MSSPPPPTPATHTDAAHLFLRLLLLRRICHVRHAGCLAPCAQRQAAIPGGLGAADHQHVPPDEALCRQGNTAGKVPRDAGRQNRRLLGLARAWAHARHP